MNNPDPLIAKMNAEILGLKTVVSVMAARMASDFKDPESFILTLTSSLRHGAEGLDPSEPMLRIHREAMNELADYIESLALD